MKLNFMKYFTFSLYVLFSYPMAGIAMDCYISSSGEARDTDYLSALAFLNGQDNGKKIWESKVYHRSIHCNAYGNRGTENVFLFPLPLRAASGSPLGSENFPTGIKFGIILNGKDYGTYDPSSKILYSIDTGWNVNTTGDSRSFTFQIYLIKDGDIDVSRVSDVLRIFQLDGQGGINTNPDAKNYSFSLSGMSNMASVSCDTQLKKNGLTLNNILTSKALAGTYKENVNPVTLAVQCTSSSSSALANVKSVNGNVLFAGTEFSGNKEYFSTGVDGLGVEIYYGSDKVNPNGNISVSIPVSNGSGEFPLELTLIPHLKNLSLGVPLWLFKDNSEIPKANINYSFSITSLGQN
ncbi:MULTISPECIES: hypothetical protein [Pantoea]|uniref:hypothetical protein n=1 Tax=Pantoea TaxID=53335 RepID=UPI001980708C|nr:MULTISPECIES: hypothetical protein [Pantoea]WRH15754.1 hypothetical protein GC087_24460 [Pantoea sp. JZ2]